MAKQFTLTEEHITLITNTYATWNNLESGAPSIDPKYPYGERDVAKDICVLLGKISKEDRDETELTEELEAWAYKLHAETETALNIILRTKSFVPGMYETEDYGFTWIKVSKQ